MNGFDFNILNKAKGKYELWKDISELKKFLWYDGREYEQRWRLIKHSYRKIYVCRIYAGSVGEFVARFLEIREDTEGKKNDLYVFIPYISPMKELSNRNLLTLLSYEICIVNSDNYGFWKYVFRKHCDELDLTYYKKYEGRGDQYYSVEKDNPLLNLSNIQKKAGRAIAAGIGLKGEYVCFHNRSEQYNVVTIGKDFPAFKKRNTRFEDYSKSIAFLAKKHIQAVRMGKYADPVKNADFINFAEKYYADFMDMFLLANCKFYVGPNSGINMVSKAFSRPILVVNNICVTVGAGCDINMKENMLIPKKYYNTRTKKFLSLRTIAKYERRFADDTREYEKKGIVLIDNTPEEILDAVIEMNERLDGVWRETGEERALQNKYMRIINELNEQNKKFFWNGGAVLYRIGSKYLRENLYLIEE